MTWLRQKYPSFYFSPTLTTFSLLLHFHNNSTQKKNLIFFFYFILFLWCTEHKTHLNQITLILLLFFFLLPFVRLTKKKNGKWKEVEISNYLGVVCPSNYWGGSNFTVSSILLLIFLFNPCLVAEKIMGKSNSQIIGSFVCHLLMQLFGLVKTRGFNFFNFICFLFK